MAVTSKPGKGPLTTRMARTNFTMKNNNEWVISTDIPVDIVVNISGAHFSLHKFPLVSRSGHIRKLVAEAKNSELAWIEFPDFPGGAEAFELATKFCYGINFEITTSNVVMLRCAAEYLEMTDDYGVKNLVACTEMFLGEVVTQSLPKAVAVLHSCENLLPYAEKLKIVSRCIDAAACNACGDRMASKLPSGDSTFGRKDEKLNKRSTLQPKLVSNDLWTEELSVLRFDFYQRVIAAMRSRGVCHESIWESLMHYSQRSLKGFNRRRQTSREAAIQAKLYDGSIAIEHEQRILVETIVSLLPPQINNGSCSFLFALLHTAIILDTTVACRLDLERRIGMQLELATLDDLLIPTFPYNGNMQFDVDLVHRIVLNFLQYHEEDDFHVSQGMHKHGDSNSPTQAAMLQVGRLVDSYLAEIAPDANLKVNKFVALAELLPDYARMVDDGLYRAIDMYLKARPSLNDQDRKKLCKLMDIHKLSQEACAHAAQNERLHVQFMIQVLYFEQLKLHAAIAKSIVETEHVRQPLSRITSDQVSSGSSPHDSYAFLRQENKDLKHEIARMKMRLLDLEKEQVSMKQDIEKSTDVASTKFFQSVSKKLGQLNPFVRSSMKDQKAPESAKARMHRHSIS
ncbi:hypothetical protein O6H91_04G130500 [Diphasiastrum complanatum]|uniref:Uncharacterized protein n=9 Tax=Diphasiastrum complanatum TaxID=34168 RepID=A0ACC2E246_DIPCM|nr:hypothetical protein O6H91_04G130500 [Diphasiastrum complanatum]KAJ7560443.1 hypothetical protein O6H91_04G130500 [Diphasiastrum complanatum]KAJ7560444.1 hypothetical protein O6H91_04G130500 [Diphasiastrum complanatum]KAJ7560445.1 hypothetical protein O6H91_04G130500 [Diphasiastrum complanatum]KAJ7560446.1 hypothetical protein O6H91_04G130500 [Diphasiastrum complanatum]